MFHPIRVLDPALRASVQVQPPVTPSPSGWGPLGPEQPARSAAAAGSAPSRWSLLSAAALRMRDVKPGERRWGTIPTELSVLIKVESGAGSGRITMRWS